jgi:hypothetical protein
MKFKRSKLTQRKRALTYIRDVLGSSLGQDNSYDILFVVFISPSSECLEIGHFLVLSSLPHLIILSCWIISAVDTGALNKFLQIVITPLITVRELSSRYSVDK